MQGPRVIVLPPTDLMQASDPELRQCCHLLRGEPNLLCEPPGSALATGLGVTLSSARPPCR